MCLAPIEYQRDGGSGARTRGPRSPLAPQESSSFLRLISLLYLLCQLFKRSSTTARARVRRRTRRKRRTTLHRLHNTRRRLSGPPLILQSDAPIHAFQSFKMTAGRPLRAAPAIATRRDSRLPPVLFLRTTGNVEMDLGLGSSWTRFAYLDSWGETEGC